LPQTQNIWKSRFVADLVGSVSSMTTPETTLAAYPAHLQDEAFVDAALQCHGAARLVDAAARLVHSLDPQQVADATLFVRDVSTGVFRPDLTQAFRACLPNSGLFEGLARCLDAPVFRLRADAVYTFGKLSCPENLGWLDRAFEARRDTDPLLMPPLLFEARWLSHDDGAHERRIRTLAASPQDFSRWAALAVIEGMGLQAQAPWVDGLLADLAQDAFGPLREEAAYRRADLGWRLRHSQLTPAERADQRAQLKSERKRVQALRPQQEFAGLPIRFWFEHPQPDYSVADLDAFLARQQLV
jgi:hypothetical protein